MHQWSSLHRQGSVQLAQTKHNSRATTYTTHQPPETNRPPKD
ncbi:hypothetical protein GCM10010294_70860 [Streptomyces griseoloalbus]|nr:hypothetical protein GCM10010294_70860 [Streptomyces griseoloalbus]